jgi:endonuclease YncB( thermonuclease family)
MAWAYRPSKKSELKAAEAGTREGKRGLWADKARVPPWEFRHR